MISEIFIVRETDPAVHRVVAETLAEHSASRRVMDLSYRASGRSGKRTTPCSLSIRPSVMAATTARKTRRLRHHPWTRRA